MFRLSVAAILLVFTVGVAQSPAFAQGCTAEAGQAAFNAGDFAEAFDIFQCAYDSDPTSEDILLGIGESALMTDQYSITANTAEMAAAAAGLSNSEYGAQQIDALNAALAKRPDSLPLLMQLAHWLWLRARDEEAMPVYEAILEADPQNLFALTFRASSQAYLGQLDDAETGFQQAAALAPNNDHVYAIAATTYLDTGDPARAVDYADQAIALQPDDFAGRYVTRGDAHTDLGNYEAALADYTRALELNPGMYDALTGLGDTSYNLSNYTAAQDYYEQAITSNPSSRYARAGLATALSSLNDLGAGQAMADLFQTAAVQRELAAGKPQTLPLDFDTVYLTSIEANAGDTIRASVESVEAGLLDPALIVLDSNGQVIAFADNTNGYDAVLDGFTIPAAGTFTVMIGQLDTIQGDVRLAVSVTPAG